MIDDGSTDDTSRRVSELKERHSIIHLYSQSNKGQGVARNFGLEKAVMKYVYMMDSDDLLVPGTLLHYVNVLERENAEVVKFNFDTRSESEIDSLRNDKNERISDDTISFMSGFKYINDTLGLSQKTSVWDMLFSRAYAIAVNARFEPALRFFDDFVFTWRLLLPARRIAVSQAIGYHYIQRPASDSHNSERSHVISRQISLPVLSSSLDNLIFRPASSEEERQMNHWLSQKRDWYNFAFWLMVLRNKALSREAALKELKRQTDVGLYPIICPYPSKYPELYPSSATFKVLYRLIQTPSALKCLIRFRLK